VILPGDWGKQLPTTTGHYHLPVEGSASLTPSPDFYQLISGDIMAILQRETKKGTEILVLQPRVGEWVLIPGEYAHSVVNIGKEPAVFANICVRTPHLTYEPILERKGMGVYVVRNSLDGTVQIIKNPNYEQIASVAMATSQPRIPNLEPLTHKKSLFDVLNNRLGDLRFLTDPDSMQRIFKPDPIQII
jgi:oxalate decarboxylase/phosphoglucose isomerase-like protein (cupin superfamily)